MSFDGLVEEAFQPAGSGDFPVARTSAGLESPANPQPGKATLPAAALKSLVTH